MPLCVVILSIKKPSPLLRKTILQNFNVSVFTLGESLDVHQVGNAPHIWVRQMLYIHVLERPDRCRECLFNFSHAASTISTCLRHILALSVFHSIKTKIKRQISGHLCASCHGPVSSPSYHPSGCCPAGWFSTACKSFAILAILADTYPLWNMQ